jgi:pimeloyl-ACP methyl ester carboxylesterase
MRRWVVALAIVAVATFAGMPLARATTDTLIEIDTGRKDGGAPVVQRAILAMPDKPADTALLFFRGAPGIARLQSVSDKDRNLQPFMRMNQALLADEGIALVVMDCPTDQWGTAGPFPNACLDAYRSTRQHADDVRGVVARLRSQYGLSKIFIMGHSMGTISSRWLAKYLGKEIDGSIHSGEISAANRYGYGSSLLAGFDYDAIAAPRLHVHHENDACPANPYWEVRRYAGDNLMTVRGGQAVGDPCGGGHLHSYQGREEVVVRAIVVWMKTGKVEHVVGQ